MNEVLHRMTAGEVCFYCPGCEHLHAVWVLEHRNPITGATWQWNGDMVKPTFSPSLLIVGHLGVTGAAGIKRCHALVENGTIRYLDDCDHRLAGVTVPMSPDPLEMN